MFFAIDTPNFGDYSEPRLLAELAKEAEDAGWDGFFLWDHIGADWPLPVADPWIALAAMAMTTRRIKLGPLVTPLPRRRPWKLARETATLDHLSHGRLILGVGIGSDRAHEYSCFAETTDDGQHTRPLRRAARFDGVVPMAEDRTLSPQEIGRIVATIQKYRSSASPFDVAFGSPDLEEKQVRELLPAYAQAGVTWWLECFSWSHALPEVRKRIGQGPPML